LIDGRAQRRGAIARRDRFKSALRKQQAAQFQLILVVFGN
jgi:hypothetical protein